MGVEITTRNRNYGFVDVVIKSEGTTIEDTIYEPDEAHEMFWDALYDTFKSHDEFIDYVNERLNK